MYNDKIVGLIEGTENCFLKDTKETKDKKVLLIHGGAGAGIFL